jgi:Asp-tRNA(Asn)/Glu-tRNA(Gln) amidotransferase A subunit family amidase
VAGLDERVLSDVRRSKRCGRGTPRSGQRGGRLAGVPIAVKELFAVRGHPVTGCCAAIEPRAAEHDAVLVARLRAAGAIVIGKTNQHELAAGVTNLESSCGPTRNPRDVTRISGGSSGGSCIAFATGVVPFSLVSDTGGSARVPAALCGVWGLKPTQGRLSTDGMKPMASTMDCPALVARDLEDLRLVWRILAASGRAQDGREHVPSVVGLLRGGRWDDCLPEVRASVDTAVDRFRAAVIEVRELGGSAHDEVQHVWNRVAWPSFADRYGDLLDHPRPHRAH